MVRFGVMEIDNSSYFNVQSNNNLEFCYIKFVYLDGYLLDRLSQTCTSDRHVLRDGHVYHLGEGIRRIRSDADIIGGEII